MPVGQMNKPCGRRHSAHASFYDGQKPKLARKKDKHVLESSNGKFVTVAKLVEHQAKVSPVIPHRKAEQLRVPDNWTTRDSHRNQQVEEYLRANTGNYYDAPTRLSA